MIQRCIDATKNTQARIKRIALDINNHFVEGYKNTGFKAMLACNYKKDAIRYKKCFDMFGDLETAVIISPPDMREGIDDVSYLQEQDREWLYVYRKVTQIKLPADSGRTVLDSLSIMMEHTIT